VSVAASSQTAVAPSSARLMRWATYASVTTACTLVAVKLVGWWLSDSVSLLSSLVDSLLDGAASVVTLLAVRQALVPADTEHRFGHGKAEPLAALGQAGLIMGSAIFVTIEAINRFITPKPVEYGSIAIGVMVFSIVLTFALTRFQAFVVKRSGSIAISADSLHYTMDLLMNAAVIMALLLATQLGWIYADPIVGLAVAIFILRSAWKIGRGSYDMLMDRELPEEERERIIAVIKEHPEVLGIHDLRTRASGQNRFIQLHLELDGGMTLYRAHAIADTVEAELEALFPGTDVIIHQDPYVAPDETPTYR